MTYSKKLNDPRWQKKRLEIYNRDNFQCQFPFDDGVCGEDSDMLHCHHLEYIKGLKPWEYPNDKLLTLCDTHHKMIHDKPFIPGIHELTELSQNEIDDGVIDRITKQSIRDVLDSLKAGRDAR